MGEFQGFAMDKICFALLLAKDCTFADEMTEGAKQHLRNVIDEAIIEWQKSAKQYIAK